MTLANSANRRPPGPDAPVLLGIDPETLGILQEATRTFGQIVAMRRPNGREVVFVNDPAAIRRILVRQHTRYRKGPGFERVKMLLGNGLIVSDENVWRRSRTMIQPAFSRGNMHQLISTIVRCCQDRGHKWAAMAEANEPLNITQETSDFALELILRAMFGDDYDTHLLSGGSNPFAFLSEDSARDLRVVLKVRELREFLLQLVAARRKFGEAGQFDFLSIYLSARDKSGNAFNNTELLDELITLIVAGYETSAGTLNWAWHLLAGHPECHQQVAAEGRRLLSGKVISPEDVAAMTYTQALLEETLRLYPPVWLFTRRAFEDDNLDEYDIAADSDIYLSPYILQRTEEFWPDAERFDPARFIPQAADRKNERAYFPFSLGPRRCLGEYFAFLEMKIHLGFLAKTFFMTSLDKKTPSLELGINLRSASDIHLQPRLSANVKSSQ